MEIFRLFDAKRSFMDGLSYRAITGRVRGYRVNVAGVN
jgi:hypothetical protein